MGGKVARSAMTIRQLATNRPRRELRWTHDGAQSLRAYAMATDEEACPCVSTRSGELNLVLEGEVVIEIGPRQQRVSVRAGEACLVPRGMPHAVRIPDAGRVLMVDVQSAIADAGLRVLPARVLPARVFRSIERAWRGRVRDALGPAHDAAAEVVERIGSQAPLEIELVPETRRMLRAKQILEERFVAPPTLAELARTVRTNEFYLLRSFKKHFSFSPIAYASFLRTEHFVWELLTAPASRTLLRLSSDAGFGDYSTFERRIRGRFGRPPSSLVDDGADARLGPGG